MRKPQRSQDFEKFYYNYVATGEGCGCAERIIDVHDADRLSRQHARIGWLGGLIRRLAARMARALRQG